MKVNRKQQLTMLAEALTIVEEDDELRPKGSVISRRDVQGKFVSREQLHNPL